MNLRQRHKPSAEFSLASISDIVFLLLIFFMITSSFVQPGVKVDLPQGSSQKPSTGKITITINKEGQFFWNTEQVVRDDISTRLADAIARDPDAKVVTLKTDKEVQMQDAAHVISAVAEHGGSVIIATRRRQ